MATFKSNTSRDYYGILTVTQGEQSIAKNETEVGYKLVMYSGDYNFSGYTIGYQVYINGKRVAYHTNSGNQTSLGKNSSKKVCSGTTTVAHNSDGTKSISVSFKIFMDKVSYLPASDLTKSGTMPLDTIPRVSSLSLDKTTVPADDLTTVTATATKKSSSFTDTLTITLGSYSKTITSGTAFTIPETWINAISGTSATATVKVTTKSGSTTIGTATKKLTVTVPDSVMPIINDVAISEAVEVVSKAFSGLYVQKLSQLNVDIDASGVYGSTIKSYSTSLDGVNYIQQAFTSNVIKTAGRLNITVKVIDSRDRSATKTVPVEVIEYALPTITAMNYTSSESSTKVTITGKVYSVEGLNTKALKLKYKSMAEESYTERVVDISDWTFKADVIINGTDPSITYEYIAELTDKMNTENPATYTVKTGVVVLSRLAGGKGLTLFEEARQEGLVVGGGKPAHFSGTMTFGNAASVRQNMNLICDVGTIAGENIAAGAYRDVTITFDKKFASTPIIFFNLISSSESSDLGKITAAYVPNSGSATGCTIRIFNGSTTTRAPGIEWKAMDKVLFA